MQLTTRGGANGALCAHAVAPAVQGVQDAMQRGMDAQAASLMQGSMALEQLIPQLEQLDTFKLPAVLLMGIRVRLQWHQRCRVYRTRCKRAWTRRRPA